MRTVPLLLLAAFLVVLACDGGPTDSGGTPPDGTGIVSVRISGPDSFQVHAVELLSAQVRDTSGQDVLSSPVTWTSSDPSMVTLEPSGATSVVVTAQRRGTVTIVAAVGGVRDTIRLTVWAQLDILPNYPDFPLDAYPMAIGDTLQLSVGYVDVSGQPITEPAPSVTWHSTEAAALSVSSTGLISGRATVGLATVTATAPDGSATLDVRVLDVLAGLPATVRIAHAIPGLGPKRVTLSQGAEVSLAYGESVELPVRSGTLHVTTDGLPRAGYVDFWVPQSFIGVVRPGDHVSIYVVGNVEVGALQVAWPATGPVPSDSGLVRLIQSSPALVVYVRARGAPMSDRPQLCYFDPGDISPYIPRAAGGFDLIARGKYPAEEEEIGRVAASVAGGHAVTMVLVGGGQQPLGVLTFPDF